MVERPTSRVSDKFFLPPSKHLHVVCSRSHKLNLSLPPTRYCTWVCLIYLLVVKPDLGKAGKVFQPVFIQL